MIAIQPPFALAPTSFRFPALASLAGRAPLGGQREVALGTFLAARLAHDMLPDRGLGQLARAERAQSARNWLSTLTLPAQVRPALVRLIDASTEDRRAAAAAVRAVTVIAATFLDARGRAELDQLATALDGH